MSDMPNALRIEVAEGMWEAVSIGPLDISGLITHPDFLRQLREQVVGCVPDEEHEGRSYTFPYGFDDTAPGFNRCRAETLANLQALFGEMK